MAAWSLLPVRGRGRDRTAPARNPAAGRPSAAAPQPLPPPAAVQAGDAEIVQDGGFSPASRAPGEAAQGFGEFSRFQQWRGAAVQRGRRTGRTARADAAATGSPAATARIAPRWHRPRWHGRRAAARPWPVGWRNRLVFTAAAAGHGSLRPGAVTSLPPPHGSPQLAVMRGDVEAVHRQRLAARHAVHGGPRNTVVSSTAESSASLSEGSRRHASPGAGWRARRAGPGAQLETPATIRWCAAVAQAISLHWRCRRRSGHAAARPCRSRCRRHRWRACPRARQEQVVEWRGVGADVEAGEVARRAVGAAAAALDGQRVGDAGGAPGAMAASSGACNCTMSSGRSCRPAARKARRTWATRFVGGEAQGCRSRKAHAAEARRRPGRQSRRRAACRGNVEAGDHAEPRRRRLRQRGRSGNKPPFARRRGRKCCGRLLRGSDTRCGRSGRAHRRRSRIRAGEVAVAQSVMSIAQGHG